MPASYQITWSWWNASEGRLTNASTIVSGDTEAYIVTELKPYETYAVYVAKVETGRNVTLDVVSAYGNGQTDPVPSVAPTNVSIIAVQTNTASIPTYVASWKPTISSSKPPVQGYLVTACPIESIGVERTDSERCKTAKTHNFTVALEGLEPFIDYDVQVRAFVRHRGHELLGEATGAVIYADTTRLPTVLDFQVTSPIEKVWKVSWKTPAGLEQISYKVVYNVSVYLSDSEKSVLTKAVDGTQTTLEGLLPLTKYTIRISVCLLRPVGTLCGRARSASYVTGWFY